VEMLLMTLKARGIQCKYLLLPSSSELPSLTSCDVSRSGVSDSDLFAFLQGLSSTKLTVLRASGCKNLKHTFGPATPADVSTVFPSLSALKEVDFSSSNIDSNFISQFVATVPHLETLSVEFCHNLSNMTFSHPRLKVRRSTLASQL
jgi:hypothetical protein